MDYIIILAGITFFLLVVLSAEQRHKGKVVVNSLIDTSLNTGVTVCVGLEKGQQSLLSTIAPELGAMTPAQRLELLENLNSPETPEA